MDAALLAAEILGIDVLESTGDNPFESRPMTNAELEQQLLKCDQTVRKALERRDQDAMKFMERYGGPQSGANKMNDFSKRLLAAAEQCEDSISPEVCGFVRGYVAGTRGEMRAAVRRMLDETG